MVNLWCSAADRIRVPDVRRRTRRSASTVGGGYTGHDHRTCRRRSRRSASLQAPAAEQVEGILRHYFASAELVTLSRFRRSMASALQSPPPRALT
jgi:hypothetical protein